MKYLSILVFFVCAVSENSYASQCILEPLETQIKEARHIFKGKVKKIEYMPKENCKEAPYWCTGDGDTSGGPKDVTFTIKKTWKGTTKKQMTFLSRPRALLGQDFKVGEEWIVFTNLSNGKSINSFCLGTTIANPELEKKLNKKFKKAN